MNKIQNRQLVYEVFEKINNREICKDCRYERANFLKDDKCSKGYLSNLSLGLVSNIIREGKHVFDVMVVLESHGGPSKNESFRPQYDAARELEEYKNYFMKDRLVRYNQQQIRQLFTELDALGYNYVATDLVKCYVAKPSKDVPKSHFNKAMENCYKYLLNQISAFKPKVILALGNSVSNKFSMKQLNHGDYWGATIIENAPYIVHDRIKQQGNIEMRNPIEGGTRTFFVKSIFPSQNTANRFVEHGEWDPVIHKIKMILNNWCY